jgi:hypothetical protein
MDIKQEVCPDGNPGAIYGEYRKRLGNEIDTYKSFNIKQLNYMWLRDRLWFVKQLIADFGREEAKKKLEGLIDQKALEIGSRYKKWAEEKSITNPILAALNGYCYDWPWIAPSWWHNFFPDEKNPTYLIWRLECLIGDFWKEQPPEYREFGLIFCDVDVKLVRHIDPRLTLERVNTMYSVKGDMCPYCKFVVTLHK